MASSSAVEVKILFFAKARELSGVKESKLLVESLIPYRSLLQKIVESFSLESIQKSVILAINEDYADCEAEIQLKAGDQIAIIPPLSGVVNFRIVKLNSLMDYVKVVNTKLSIEEISDLVAAPSCGAISLFVGTTRDNFDNKQVVQLEYEAYEPMAVKAMKKVCEDVRHNWQVENIAIYHRLGVVPVKEASIVIAISSPHRAESLQAVQFAIDSIKASTPIWKKEVYSSQESEWKENRECAWKSLKTTLEDARRNVAEEVLTTTVKLPVPALDVPSHLIQIKADSKERRINSFIERKRDQVNLGNIQDFCSHGSTPVNEYSCARVDALLIRRKDSKSHLRVRRVLNTWGPQTRGLDPGSLGGTDPEDPMATLMKQNTVKAEPREDSGVEERLGNAETHLRMRGPIPTDIYQRLKQIEDRILYLEGLSPEYFHLWSNSEREEDSRFHRTFKKKKYSAAELDTKLCDLKYKLSMKLSATRR
ncbi:hypothetical protein L9F63_008592 [Diploptera punctata]|uniref:Molybdopterin synthase catalytic subunit n=1 Tax=Diploptera punctata TaxID=6984 RepID=A0AAD7Z5C6_DIPPU|nr:hypothetical protein L9F63_008592 [Diploptera punctata]